MSRRFSVFALLLGFGVLLAVGVFFGLRNRHAPQHTAKPSAGAALPAATSSAPNSAESAHAAASAAPVPMKRRQGGLDVTFMVAADTHLGFDTFDRDGKEVLAHPMGIERTNLKMIQAMNQLPGKAFPRELNTTVGEPRGVLIAGDLTEDGGQKDWVMFEALYGLTGKEGPLRFPVYEGTGNHDRNRDWYVREQVIRRHGGYTYAIDFDDLHVICMGEAPDAEGLTWLAKDLQQVERDVPVVVYFHYPLQGPFSENNWFGEGNYRQRFADTIQGWNIVGIFHGHYHASGAYRWQGYNVYYVGSPKYIFQSFVVARVTDTLLTVAAWNYSFNDWWWWHQKPIGDAAASGAAGPSKERSGLRPQGKEEARPELDL